MGISYKRALNLAMSKCSRSEKCCLDISDSLIKWGIESENDRMKIIDELLKNDFINEERYSRAYVLDKHRFNKWGRVKITSMLCSKQIDTHLINDAIEALDDDAYFETLKTELTKKRSSIKASNEFDLKGKLIRFAEGRGYEADLIFRALDEIL